MRLSVDRVLLKAKSHAKKGEISDAEALYGTVLAKFPSNKRAQQGLAALTAQPATKPPAKPAPEQVNALISLYNQGRLQDVVNRANVLVSQFPQSVVLFNLLGAANAGLHRFDAAIENYNRALQIQPDYAEAHNNLGNALQAKGDLTAAIESYRRALQIEPDKAQRHNNLGIALQANGDLTEAADSYNRALQIQPDYAEAHNNLGNTLQAKGDLADAVESYNRALHIQPDYAEAHSNLGLAVQAKGDLVAAVESYRRALQIRPDYAVAHNNLGNALQEKGELTDAIESYNRALRIQPNDAEAHNNLAGALKAKGDLPAAIESYDRALQIRPDYATVIAQKLYQKAKLCDWNTIDQDRDLISNLNVAADVVTPFSLLALEDNPARHRERAEWFARNKYKQPPLPPITRPAKKPERLRVGYFSADFHQHPAMYLMARMFELHDKDRFAIHAYSYARTTDDMTARVQSAFDVFHDVRNLSDKAVAELARREQIDIAIDRNGHTRYSRSGILAYRAAPLQLNYLGFPCTMGAPFMDYIIADPVLIPEESRKFYSEKILYLPHTYQVSDNTRQIAEQFPSKADYGLPDSGVVFCCFNNNYKLRPQEFDIWMRLLTKVEGSVLWLLKSNEWSNENLRKEAQARGVNPDRLIFAEWLPMEEHLARHRHADIFLDTFIYNAHTTANDALWAGLPVVTKLGEGFAARVAASLLTAIGLTELITTNEHDYEQVALELAVNAEKRQAIKAKLAMNRDRTPLFDTERFTRNIEQAYTQIYDRYFNGEEPDHLFVKDDATH